MRDIRETLINSNSSADVDGDYCGELMQISKEVLYCNFSCDEQSLIYIAGYAVRKVLFKCACECCLSLVMSDREMLISEDSILDYHYV